MATWKNRGFDSAPRTLNGDFKILEKHEIHSIPKCFSDFSVGCCFHCKDQSRWNSVGTGLKKSCREEHWHEYLILICTWLRSMSQFKMLWCTGSSWHPLAYFHYLAIHIQRDSSKSTVIIFLKGRFQRIIRIVNLLWRRQKHPFSFPCRIMYPALINQ